MFEKKPKTHFQHFKTYFEFCIIGQEELDEIKEALSTQDMPTAITKIKNVLEQQDRVELNIAVTGESGSGKSSFVNAFRGIGDEEEGSDKTGPVETTKKTQVYLHPKYENVKVWDLPGIGTPNFKANEYLRQVQFERYDFFIIIASDRFRECHTQLAKEIMRMGKKFYFVKAISKYISVFSRIDKNCRIQAPVVFLISCFELGKYDFNLLQERLEKELPQHKRHVLMLAIPNITLEINEREKEALEKSIPRVALLSAGVATIPIPGLSALVDKYYSVFGLDDPSLQMLCERSGKTIEELKNVMKSPLHLGINPTALIGLLGAAALYVSENAVEYVCSLVPVLGTMVAGGMSYLTISKMLKKALNELAEDAKNVLIASLETEV
ncbi:putative immunity-related GTPase family [Triplophysa rosa]|uniref:Immunity-related GTPase family n=1 Tax=Triplophysa rosa TaxID=992332 RepID=A0A9W7T5E1_TRIRA|nr:putative immunity-related GTPase family [Triplophysa rosa]